MLSNPIDPAAPIVWLLRGAQPIGMIPYVRLLLSTAALAHLFVTTPMYITGGGDSSSPDAISGTNLYTQEIQKYEFSALGSTRII